MDSELLATIITTVSANIVTIIGCIASVVRIFKDSKSEEKKLLKEERANMQELKAMMLARERKYDELLKNLDREQKRRLKIKEDD